MAEKPAKGMACIDCGEIYPIAPINYSDCHFAPLQVSYSPKNIGGLKKLISEGPENLFRYEPFLPTSAIPYNVGLTKLERADELAKILGIKVGHLYVKFGEDLITGTFKDRGVAIVAQLVREFNSQGYSFEALGGTSTGNLASAIAAAAGLINLKSIVLVHGRADEELVKKTLSFGSYVLRVKDDYSNVDGIMKNIASFEEKINSRVAWTNITLRPLYSQGSKTVGFEVVEQLGWKAPDNIVHPVAAGLSLWQIYEGLNEFKKFGLIDNLQTRMHAGQTTSCDPVVRAWEKGYNEVIPMNAGNSIAETLCVGSPSNGNQVLEVLKQSKGSAVSVGEDQILEGINLVSQTTDWKTGPVGGVVVASAKKLVSRGTINPDELTVLVLTDGYSGKKTYQGPYNPEQVQNKLIKLEPDAGIIKGTLESILDGRR